MKDAEVRTEGIRRQLSDQAVCAYERGYQDGKADGFKQGYDEGYALGYDEGYALGKTDREKETDLRLGDEVELLSGGKGIVTNVDGNSPIVLLSNGDAIYANYENLKKTGRHYEEIQLFLMGGQDS